MLAGCRDSAEQMPPTVTAQHDHDRIEWRTSVDDNGSSIGQLVVQCPEGIGQLELGRPETGWPAVLTVELHLAGLEGLTLTANEQRFRLEVTSDQQVLLEPSMANPLTLMVMPQDDDPEKVFIIAVSLGQNFATAPKLSLRWVDFYR